MKGRISTRARLALGVISVSAVQVLGAAPAAQAWNCHDALGPETCEFVYGADEAALLLVNETYAEVAEHGNNAINQAYQAVDEQRDRAIAIADEAYATVRCYATGECPP